MSDEYGKDIDKAIRLIEEKYGMKLGKVVRFPELSATVRVPIELLDIASRGKELTSERRVAAVAETDFCLNWSRSLCRMMTGEEDPEYVSYATRALAERLVSQILP